MHMHFCENQVIDSVISYYCALAERNTIPFHVQIDLPAQISVDETDFCLVLSNLLENALEASLKTAKFRQRIDIKIYRHASNLILIQIENAFDGKIQQKHGIFLSSKRNENGIGIQSVRHIVEKTGGGCDFTYDNGIFNACNYSCTGAYRAFLAVGTSLYACFPFVTASTFPPYFLIRAESHTVWCQR